ncbi:MAG: type II 3-dehydroquinate dehydratase [Deltaproteobacteria bacterium]|nr:type II 3-dehydroquinate dehydratase [Deltaproteobacteria bacterium]
MIPTVTLARIYEKQGLLKKAAEVYRTLIQNDPDRRSELAAALAEVEQRRKGAGHGSSTPDTRAVLSALERWQRAVRSRKAELDLVGSSPTQVLVLGASGRDAAGPNPADELNLHDLARECDDPGMKVDVVRADQPGRLVAEINGGDARYHALVIVAERLDWADTDVINALSTVHVPVVAACLSNATGGEKKAGGSGIGGAVTAFMAGMGKTGCIMAVKAAGKMARESTETAGVPGLSGRSER